MFRELWRNKYIKTAIIFSITFITTFLADFVLKYVFFDKHLAMTSGTTVQHDAVVIGIRSLAHGNSTLFSFMHFNMPEWGHHIMSFGLAGLLMVWVVQAPRTKFTIIALSILIGSIFGNGMDRLYNGYVRDIFFIPFYDKGTFNLADITMVTGAGLCVIAVVREYIKFDRRK